MTSIELKKQIREWILWIKFEKQPKNVTLNPFHQNSTMLTRILFALLVLSMLTSSAQEAITANLYETYATYKEPSLDKRRIKHHQLQPLIQKFRENPKFKVNKVGESIEGRGLHLISIGSGSINVFLWSQMHGNEPTATQAIFDILNFLDAPEFEEEKQKKDLTLD